MREVDNVAAPIEMARRLVEYCASDSLSHRGLKWRTRSLRPFPDLPENADIRRLLLDGLHFACSNECVTERIIRRLLNLCPGGAGILHHRENFDYETFPLHRACFNNHCPGSVIRLLVKRYPFALKSACDVKGSNLMAGLPIHFYLSRGRYSSEVENVDLDILRTMAKEWPTTLTIPSGRMGCTPLYLACSNLGCLSLDIVRVLSDKHGECFNVVTGQLLDGVYGGLPVHGLLRNSRATPFPLDILQFFIQNSPLSVFFVEQVRKSSCLHLACDSENLSAQLINVLFGIGCKYQLRQLDDLGRLPLHNLCHNWKIDQELSLDLLKAFIAEYPQSVRIADKNGHFPLHFAAYNRSLNFCKILVAEFQDCAAAADGMGRTPLHNACLSGNSHLLRYFYDLNPHTIFERTTSGETPLHLVAAADSETMCEMISFILLIDSFAASVVDNVGATPFHKACSSSSGPVFLDAVKLLFRSYPEAIHKKDNLRRLPIDMALARRSRENEGVIRFLGSQLPYSLVSPVDGEGRTRSHLATDPKSDFSDYALRHGDEEFALARVKVLAEINPESFRLVSQTHGLPIHYACKRGASLSTVLLLARLYPESLQYEHPTLGIPLNCAPSGIVFLELLSKRYTRPLNPSNPTVLHYILRDKQLKKKEGIISQFAANYWDDFGTKYCRGIYPLHLMLGSMVDLDLIRRSFNRFPSALTEQCLVFGWLPLHYALRNSAPAELIRKLVDSYRDSIGVFDHLRRLPIHLACQYGCSLEVVKLLAESDLSSVLQKDANGCVPFHYACRNGQLDVVRYMLDFDERVLLIRDDMNDLPLHKSCRGCHYDIAKLLLDRNTSTVVEKNNMSHLPTVLLCLQSSRREGIDDSVEYVETLWQFLLAHPACFQDSA
ncbi:hypothetical protein ACHAWF_010172 [Thalassiosira exigua]